MTKALAALVAGGALLLAATHTHTYNALNAGGYVAYGSTSHGACHLIGLEVKGTPGLFSGDFGFGPIEKIEC